MTKLRKSAITIVALLSASLFGASAVAYSFSNKAEGGLNAASSDIRLLNGVNSKTESYFDSNVVYRLPETVSSDDEISVIVSMSVDSVMDVYSQSHFSGSFQSFLRTEEARAASAKIERESANLIKTLKGTGIKYTVGEKYDTLISGFEITISASDFDAVNEIFEGDNELIVGDRYYQEQTEVVVNDVDVYETGIFDSSDSEYQGDGVVVAVLDTGCDYTHTAFSVGNFHPTQTHPEFTLNKLNEKISSTTAASFTAGLTGSDVYVNEKIPFAYDYADRDSDVAPISNQHGTHVAGIIAGKDDVITGVAPNAQLAIMKCFSDAMEDAKSSWILAALEDCVKLGVDVINMSLGTSCGFSREIDKVRINEIYDAISDAGISVVAAASNDYNSTFGSEKNGNLGLTSNPDSATIGSPGSYTSSLAVASVDGVKTPYLKYGKDIIYFTEAMTSSVKKKNFVDDILKTVGGVDSYDFEYVTIPGVGRSSDYIEQGDFYHGKIVLVRRGVTMFEDKVRVALTEKGAAGIIIYNNVSGTINMSVGKDVGAVCSISQDEGEKLAAAGTGILRIGRDYTAGPFMSDFSSWGPTPDLKIKPEITAHGGEIYSCVPGQDYDRMSGTSMAAPNQAGATALIRQYVKFGTNSDGSKIFGELTAKEVNARVNQLMMSTADIVYNKNGLPYAVRKQGAGLMNIIAATTSESYITTYEADGEGNLRAMDKSKIELGDDKDRKGVYEMTFDINNVSKKSVSYAVDAIIMSEGVSSTYTSHGDTTVSEEGYILDGASFEITSVNGGTRNGSQVTVNAGGTAKVSVKITLSDKDKKYLDASFKYGMYVEGFITLQAKNGTSVDLSVPLLAFYGDWTEAPIFDEEYYDTNKDEINAGLDDEDKLMPDAFATRVLGGLYSDYISVLGTYYFVQDPTATQIAADKNKIAISNLEGESEEESAINRIRYIYAGLLRNCREVNIVITEDATGREIFNESQYNRRKSYSSGASIYAASIDLDFSALKHNLKNNTKYTVTVNAYIDYGENSQQNNARNTFTFPLYIDFEAPVVTDVVYRSEYNRSTKETKLYADLSIYDNHYAMGVTFGQALKADAQSEAEGYLFSLESFGKYVTPVYSSFNSTSVVTIELTDYVERLKDSYTMGFEGGESYAKPNPNSFLATCYDYAMNSATYEIPLPDEFLQMYFEQDNAHVFEDGIRLSPNETLDLTTVLKVYPEDSWIQTLDFSIDNDSRSVADVVNQTLVAKQSGNAVLTVKGYDAEGNETKISIAVKVLSEDDEGYVGNFTVPQVNKFALTSYFTNKAYYSDDPEDRGVGETGNEYDFGGVYSLSMYPSESITVKYKLDAYFPERTEVIYSVGNSRIATVDEKGTIIAQEEGTTIVTASVRFDGGSTLYSQRITITVKDPFTTNNIYLTSYKGLGGEVEVPSDRGVTTIASFAFSNVMYVPKDTDNGDIIDDEDPYVIKQWFIGENTITKVIIPEGVEEIQSYAFANLTALEEVVLPTTLKKIGLGAFWGCVKLNTVNLEHVKFINSKAFQGCALANIDLSSVVAIGNYTFADNRLGALTLPVSSQSLGEGAFEGNKGLATVEFKASKIKIAPYVFYGCSSLREISINAAVISSFAFADCPMLRTVTLGADVAVIGEYAFANTQVARFNLSSDNKVLSTPNNGVDIYEGDKLVLRAPYADEAIGEITVTATEIATGAFSGNTSITKVYAPNATAVGAFAFASCTNLQSINIPNLQVIGEHAFDGTRLKQTPDLTQVEEIGAYAFAGSQLESVVIPEYTKVGEGAFYNCVKLVSVTIGDYAELGYAAFAKKLKAEPYEVCGVFDNNYYEQYTYTAPNNSGSPKYHTYYRFNIEKAFDSALDSVSVGREVTIGESAFAGNVTLASLTLGNGAVIGKNAFLNTIKLTSVDLSGVVSIGEYAFSGSVAYDYEVQTSPSGKEYYRAVNYFIENGEEKATEYINSYFTPGLTSVNLSAATTVEEGAFAYSQTITEATLGNLEVIAPLAFAMNVALANVNITSSVKAIGDYAFYHSLLTSLDLSGVEEIGDFAFASNNLASVTLKEGVKIGGSAFANNDDLASVVNLDKAVEIGSYAFLSAKITEAALTSAVKIGDFAFALSAVKKVTLGSALEELGENPFFGCEIASYGKTEDVTFNGVKVGETLQETYDISQSVKVIGGVLYQTVPNGLELVSYPMAKADTTYAIVTGAVRISARAFAGAPLKYVTIAYTVKTIGDKAFYGCSDLAVVTFLSYNAPILEEEFDETYSYMGESFPVTGDYYGYEGLGISKYFMWSLSSSNNYYYGANFVDYIGCISDNIVMVRPVNGQNYDTFIMSQYFGTKINGAVAATDDTLYVIALIDKIPESITLNDEAVIVAAREAFERLPSLDQRGIVENTNLSKLINAEQTLEYLKLRQPGNPKPDDGPEENGGSKSYFGYILAGIAVVAMVAYIAWMQIKGKKAAAEAQQGGYFAAKDVRSDESAVAESGSAQAETDSESAESEKNQAQDVSEEQTEQAEADSESDTHDEIE